MVSMINAQENMVVLMSGSALLNYLTTFLLLLLSKISFSVYMVAYHLALKLWITSEHLKGSKKYLMKDQCVTYSGLILMTVQVGV